MSQLMKVARQTCINLKSSATISKLKLWYHLKHLKLK